MKKGGNCLGCSAARLELPACLPPECQSAFTIITQVRPSELNYGVQF